MKVIHIRLPGVKKGTAACGMWATEDACVGFLDSGVLDRELDARVETCCALCQARVADHVRHMRASATAGVAAALKQAATKVVK